MGAHSTINLSRAAVIEYLTETIPLLPNNKLEELMDILLSEQLYNCRVFNNGEDDDLLAYNRYVYD